VVAVVGEYKVGFAALERMNARSSSGFDVNDDEEEGLLLAWPR